MEKIQNSNDSGFLFYLSIIGQKKMALSVVFLRGNDYGKERKRILQFSKAEPALLGVIREKKYPFFRPSFWREGITRTKERREGDFYEAYFTDSLW